MTFLGSQIVTFIALRNFAHRFDSFNHFSTKNNNKIPTAGFEADRQNRHPTTYDLRFLIYTYIFVKYPLFLYTIPSQLPLLSLTFND